MPGGSERVPPGKYAVLIQWPEPVAPASAPAAPPTPAAGGKAAATKAKKKRPQKAEDRFKNFYSNPGKPRLHAEVAAGSLDVGTFTLDDPDPKELAKDAPRASYED
jgi:hypothetical protein